MERMGAMDTAVLMQAHRSRRARFLTEFAGWQQFTEDFLSLTNGWLLLVATGVSLVALMLDIRQGGASSWAWALAQVFGVDLQFIACVVRARSSWAQANYTPMVLWSLLALILGGAIWQATYVYSVENATGQSESQVFQQLGMSLLLWLGWRAFLLVVLVAVAGVTRHSRTITDAHLAAAANAPTAPTAPTPPDGPNGGLPAAALESGDSETFALAQPPASVSRNRKTLAPVASDPRTARPTRVSTAIRAQREAFARQFFAEHPEAGPSDLAQALNIRPGGTVQRLWERYGKAKAA